MSFPKCQLDLGEAETIVLAYEMGTDWVLMGERKGRRKLSQLGLNKGYFAQS